MKIARKNFGHTNQCTARIIRPRAVQETEPFFDPEGRYQVFDCGFSQGRFRTKEAAVQYAVRFWGGYVIDRETGERAL